jgi:hypothetical protein
MAQNVEKTLENTHFPSPVVKKRQLAEVWFHPKGRIII